MGKLGLARVASQAKVIVLTGVVIASFLLSSLAWRKIELEQWAQIVVAAVILVSMYTLMIFELVNRNLAALIGAAASVAAYDCLVEYVDMEEILEWEDLETLTLLFGMMIIVNVLSASGLFNFLAVWCYRRSGGHFWMLVFIMSLITAFLSAFIDNVSTMLLMSPTLIKLGELEHIDPRYLLIIMVVCSNIGGCATPVGDPPNLIIIGDPFVKKLGVTFSSFVAISGPCVLITLASILLYLRLLYKSKESFRLEGYEPSMRGSIRPSARGSVRPAEVAPEHQLGGNESPARDEKIQELTRSLKALLQDHQAAGEPNDKHICELQQQIGELESSLSSRQEKRQPKRRQLERESSLHLTSKANQLSIEMAYQASAAADERRGSRLTDCEMVQLLRTYSIKSKATLWLSLSVLVVAVLLFFVQSMPNSRLTLGWISLFAGLTLLVASSAIRPGQSDDDDDEMRGGADLSDATSIGSGRSSIMSRRSAIMGAEGGGAQPPHGHDNFEFVINNIEWSTLSFFFALFIVMEVMAKLGLIQFVGAQIISLIDVIPAGSMREVGAICIVLWASGLASACIDNVPFTSMMIKVLGSMAASGSSAPIKPLVFALSFGACYGGNGTLIGASANLVTAGLAGRFNYPITFNSFFKFSAPITVISLLIANIYLVIVFVLLEV